MYEEDLNDDGEGIDFGDPEDSLDEPETDFAPEGDDLDDVYPSMGADGKREVPPEMRNDLDSGNQEKIDEVIRQRIEELRVDVGSDGSFSRDELVLMVEALRADLEGQTVDQLFSYDRKRQKDYDSLKFKVESRLGRNVKDGIWGSEEEKMNELYPSMKDEIKSFRKALGLPPE